MPVTPVLDLDVIAPERPNVKLTSTLHPKAKFYEMRLESEMSMEDIARLATLTKTIDPLVNEDRMEPAQAALLDAWLDEALGIVFHTQLEPDVLAEMGYAPKWRVIEHFGETCMDQSATVQETPTPKPPRAKSSTGAS